MHRRDWLKWVSASAGLAAIAGGNEQARAQPPMCPTVVPESVVAVIIYKAERPFAKCFAFATAGRTELGIFRTKSHCDGLLPGENPVWVGESLRLAYVDSVGRLSNQSNHVSVR